MLEGRAPRSVEGPAAGAAITASVSRTAEDSVLMGRMVYQPTATTTQRTPTQRSDPGLTLIRPRGVDFAGEIAGRGGCGSDLGLTLTDFKTSRRHGSGRRRGLAGG